MSFGRHGKSIHAMGHDLVDHAPLIAVDESPAGYSLAGCAPAEPASASPMRSECDEVISPWDVIRKEALMTRVLCLVVIVLGSTAYGQSQKTGAPQPDQNRAQQLSPGQKEVWKGEQNSFRYLNAKDQKGYMSLWDENFLGWPDYSEYPVRKADIESSVVEEFQGAQAAGQVIPAPQPEAIGVFGDTAVTYYFWPEADQSSPVKYRTTHTWQRGAEGWHIIGGMACEVPRVSGSAAAAKSDDVSTLDAIIAASYDALSGPPGTPRQWERYRSLLDPQARLVSASVDAATGQPTIVRWNREEYAASANEYLVKTGFVDRKLGCVTNQYGNVAAVRCGFEGLEQSKLVERGVAIYQLYNDGKRWWITSVAWDQERPGNPVPAELLTKK
jgi:hypothetical protein